MGTTLGSDQAEHGSNRTEHRATYTLQCGVWYATCKACGFQVSDPIRQRAANTYREHIKEERLAGSLLVPLLIDLSDEPGDETRRRALRS